MYLLTTIVAKPDLYIARITESSEVDVLPIVIVLTDGYSGWEIASLSGLGWAFYGAEITFVSPDGGPLTSVGGIEISEHRTVPTSITWRRCCLRRSSFLRTIPSWTLMIDYAVLEARLKAVVGNELRLYLFSGELLKLKDIPLPN